MATKLGPYTDNGASNVLADNRLLKNKKAPYGTAADSTPSFADYAGGRTAKIKDMTDKFIEK